MSYSLKNSIVINIFINSGFLLSSLATNIYFSFMSRVKSGRIGKYRREWRRATRDTEEKRGSLLTKDDRLSCWYQWGCNEVISPSSGFLKTVSVISSGNVSYKYFFPVDFSYDLHCVVFFYIYIYVILINFFLWWLLGLDLYLEKFSTHTD